MLHVFSEALTGILFLASDTPRSFARTRRSAPCFNKPFRPSSACGLLTVEIYISFASLSEIASQR